jgi:hypothetical protein
MLNSIIRNLGAIALASCCGLSSSQALANISEAQKKAVTIAVTQNTGTEYAITVDLAKQRYRFITAVDNYENPESLAKQKALMGWVGNYLFVRHQCGNTYEWRCVVDQVFTIDASKLVHLGSVESRACATLGCSYDAASGLFTDIYDGLQTNPVTGDVDAPPLRIARRVEKNTLVSDLEATWAMNTADYNTALACLNHVANNGFAVPCADKMSPWVAIVSAAKLTHYTGRTAKRSALFDVLGKGYCEKSADSRCGFRVAGAKDHFSRFAVGDAPKYIPSPVASIDLNAVQAPTQMVQPMQKGKTIQLK